MKLLSTTLSGCVSFDLREASNEQNGFDTSRIHPYNFKIEIVDYSGVVHTTTLDHIATLTKMLAYCPSSGPFIDHCYSYFSREAAQELLKGV